ncbi:MAG TPA: thioredoxin family protein [Tepidisphaeraceae bacterium]|nr:thioredoxin family protein [Tepidisphaeraceae bacterium]
MRKLFLAAPVMALVMLVATTAQAAVKVGEAAPDFSLENHKGETVNLSDLKGKIVVLEWFNEECPYVVKHYKQGHMQKLANKYAEKGVVWLAINSTNGKTNADNASVADKWSMPMAILNDSDGTVGKQYGATNTPHMYVIDAEGKIAYMGAIDSDRSADTSKVDGATNYVAEALDALLAGESVKTAETRAYGCSVKYPRK